MAKSSPWKEFDEIREFARGDAPVGERQANAEAVARQYLNDIKNSPDRVHNLARLSDIVLAGVLLHEDRREIATFQAALNILSEAM
jgi:hypothetical protein